LETFAQASLLAWYGKKLNLTLQNDAFINQKKRTTTQKIKPGLVASYNIRPGTYSSALHKFVTYFDTYPLKPWFHVKIKLL